MNLKQRLLVLAASVLPVLALSAYLFLSPVKVAQASCPAGEEYAGQGCTNNFCNDGHGGCEVHPGAGGIFVFCKTSSGGASGPGTCSTTGSCVTCTYGIL
jgi:hypothetical protein